MSRVERLVNRGRSSKPESTSRAKGGEGAMTLVRRCKGRSYRRATALKLWQALQPLLVRRVRITACYAKLIVAMFEAMANGDTGNKIQDFAPAGVSGICHPMNCRGGHTFTEIHGTIHAEVCYGRIKCLAWR